MSTLKEWQDWQKAEPGRHVDISIKPKFWPKEHESEIKIWAYSTVLETGQHVQNVEEIDLVSKKEAEERKKLNDLKKKYEVKDYMGTDSELEDGKC